MTRSALILMAFAGLTALSACGRSVELQPQDQAEIAVNLWVVGGYR